MVIDQTIRQIMDDELNAAIAESGIPEVEFLRRVIAVSQEYGHDTLSAIAQVKANG